MKIFQAFEKILTVSGKSRWRPVPDTVILNRVSPTVIKRAIRRVRNKDVKKICLKGTAFYYTPNAKFHEWIFPTKKEISREQVGVLTLFVQCGMVKSNSEARKMIQQNALRINNELITDPTIQIIPSSGMKLSLGKKKEFIIP